MTNIQSVLVAGLLLSLVACGNDPDQTDQSSKEGEAKVVAVVEGHTINDMDVTLHLAQRQEEGRAIGLTEVVEELINLKVVAINAEKDGYLEREDIKAEIRRQHNGILANAYIQDRVRSFDISDDELENEYKQQLSGLPSHEFNASHILAETREDALAALSRVESGDEFGRVASETSTGPSAENGGELGWFRLDSMVPEFSAALEKLDIGDYGTEPVKTSFGWHIIRLNDKRPVEHPAFEKVKEDLRTIVINNRLNDEVQALRKELEVEIK